MNNDSKHSLKNVVVYSTHICPFCTAAKQLLENLGIDYREIDVSGDQGKREEMRRLSRRSTVPQIFIDGEHIGGYTDLAAYLGR